MELQGVRTVVYHILMKSRVCVRMNPCVYMGISIYVDVFWGCEYMCARVRIVCYVSA